MSRLEASVNRCLSIMTKTSGIARKVLGEQDAFRICEERYQEQGGILYHSFTFPTDPACAGAVRKGKSGAFYKEDSPSSVQVTVLLATDHKVFCLDVKTYHSREITLTDERIAGCLETDYSPIHQMEMNCRHLYAQLYPVLPDGSPDYIQPVVVFADKGTLRDNRSEEQRTYIPAVTMDRLKSTLTELDRPLDYSIDLVLMEKRLQEITVGCRKVLKRR